MKYPWFRFYSEALNDRKIVRVCRNTGEPKVVIVGAWVVILTFANDSPSRGVLLLTDDIPVTIEDLATELGIDTERAALIVHQFVRLGLVTEGENGVLSVTNWENRQFSSDNSTERVRKYRQKHQGNGEETAKGRDCNGDETLQKRFCNGPDTDTDTDTDTDNTISSASADYQAIRKRWIELFPDKPKPRENNKTLSGKARTRMKSTHFRENWEAALVRAAKSKFCNDGGWFDLGWFLKNDDHYSRCLQGNYDDKKGRGYGHNQGSRPAGARGSQGATPSSIPNLNDPSPEQIAADRAAIAERDRKRASAPPP